MESTVRAAVEIGRQFGVDSDDPTLLQETNNTLVWLRPHPFIAKVGTHHDSDDVLTREFSVASALFALGAAVVEPVGGDVPVRHGETGFTVTLWRRLVRVEDAVVSEADVGESLQRVHEALALSEIALPDFKNDIDKARGALSNDEQMSAVPPRDVAFLRRSFDELLRQLAGREFPTQPLHGEPHAGNYIVTASGVRWLDFESSCVGPLEWDLAYLSDGARSPFAVCDHDLLALCRSLISACVATWCGVQARFPEMRLYGQEHLGLLRSAMS